MSVGCPHTGVNANLPCFVRSFQEIKQTSPSMELTCSSFMTVFLRSHGTMLLMCSLKSGFPSLHRISPINCVYLVSCPLTILHRYFCIKLILSSSAVSSRCGICRPPMPKLADSLFFATRCLFCKVSELSLLVQRKARTSLERLKVIAQNREGHESMVIEGCHRRFD